MTAAQRDVCNHAKAQGILDTGYGILDAGCWIAKEVGVNLCVCPDLRLMIDNLIL